jgi:hypothetical protein
LNLHVTSIALPPTSFLRVIIIEDIFQLAGITFDREIWGLRHRDSFAMARAVVMKFKFEMGA